MPITSHIRFYSEAEYENTDCPKPIRLVWRQYCGLHKAATIPATAMTAAARLPTLWLEAPPVD